MSDETLYTTWARITGTSNSPDDTVDDFMTDWVDDHDIEGIKAAYRNAIDQALPAGVALVGNEFIGPARPEQGEFDGYPVDEYGGLDIAAIVEDVDLGEIAPRFELLDINEVAARFGYEGKNPAATARSAVSRLGVERAGLSDDPRPRALFRAGDVEDAIAARPGKGNRTSRS
ncbi:hypothetical protein AB0903_29115 [Streptomyces sp. NPDC048389]|uniref:hypothetical protein n=1 Tax=Streptomyces sp. NPDC048389 TaxID=3154622 RepID=UPI0034531847